MDTNDLRGAVIEIVERRDQPMTGVGGEFVVPNEVRINGQRLLTVTKEHPIKVHPIELSCGDMVLVTLTLVAKRVVVAAEVTGDGSGSGD